MKIFMPSVHVVLLAGETLAILVVVAWLVGGMAPIPRVVPRRSADSHTSDDAALNDNALSTKKVA